jgi:hypothetical protein
MLRTYKKLDLRSSVFQFGVFFIYLVIISLFWFTDSFFRDLKERKSGTVWKLANFVLHLHKAVVEHKNKYTRMQTHTYELEILYELWLKIWIVPYSLKAGKYLLIEEK